MCGHGQDAPGHGDSLQDGSGSLCSHREWFLPSPWLQEKSLALLNCEPLLLSWKTGPHDAGWIYSMVGGDFLILAQEGSEVWLRWKGGRP
jgi:hypothetical protein